MSIVYSTGVGRICPGCRRPSAECVCKSAHGTPVRPDGGADSGQPPNAGTRLARR